MTEQELDWSANNIQKLLLADIIEQMLSSNRRFSSLMFGEHLLEKILIGSVIITNRTRKDFGDIKSLAESISAVGLLQPIVINENNELIDGQRRIKACMQLGIKEIPFYRVSLEQIILGEFHANLNRKDFTSSERVAISNAVEGFLRKHSKGVGRPGSVQKSDKTTIKESRLSADSTNERSENNVVNLTTFSGRVKDNVSRYLE